MQLIVDVGISGKTLLIQPGDSLYFSRIHGINTKCGHEFVTQSTDLSKKAHTQSFPMNML